MATKKFSPAQLAAQKLFAERARAGTLGKGKRKAAVKRKTNPVTETLIYGLAPGETRDYMEDLMYAGGQKLTQAQIDKVIKAAGDAGYHSFRVAGFDPTMKPDFAAAVRRKRNPGLYDNINAKRARIAAGSGERMRRPGSKGAPTQEAFEQSAMTAKRNPVNTFSASQIARLKSEYSKINRINPDSEQYEKLLILLDGLDLKSLKALADADVKFVSALARNRVFRRTNERKPNPDKSKPRAYVKRASQITGAPPSKRLVSRRKKALSAPAGYFPNPEPTHDFARIGKPFVFGDRTWKVSQYSHNGKTIEAYTTDRKKFIRREFDVSELMSTRRKTNPATAMMTGYQVICMHPKKHVVGIFKTMAEAKLVARAMADAKGVAYAVKTVKVHKSHFAV